MFIDKNYVLKEAEQFPLDEILDKSKRVVRGWASVEVKDSQGEIIPINELKRVMNTWMDRGGMITDTHSNRVVGKGLNWAEKIHPETKKPGIVIDYKIHKDYSIDDDVWDEIKSGKRKGLSFGGRALNEPKFKKDRDGKGFARELSGIEAYEMASVDDPANKFAENTYVNFLAKSNKEIKKDEEAELLINDLQLGYSTKDVNKPFAGFEDFETCVKSQNERGHTGESSERICGWLKHRTEKRWMDGEKKVSEKFKEGQDVIVEQSDKDSYQKATFVEDKGDMAMVKIEDKAEIETEKDNISDPKEMDYNKDETLDKGPDKLLEAFRTRLSEEQFSAVNAVFEGAYNEAYPEGMESEEKGGPGSGRKPGGGSGEKEPEKLEQWSTQLTEQLGSKVRQLKNEGMDIQELSAQIARNFNVDGNDVLEFAEELLNNKSKSMTNKMDTILKLVMMKNLHKKLHVVSKILKYKKEKQKSSYKIVNLPGGAGKVLEVEFPDGERQVLQLKKKEK